MSDATATSHEGAGARARQLVLAWLIRFRWLAAAGQLAVLAVTSAVLPGLDALAVLGPVFVVTVASNLALASERLRRSASDATIGGVLAFDTLVLTLAVAASGGPGNPFSILYVVHIAMAVVVGRSAWSWGLAGLVGVAYAAQFAWHVETQLWHRSVDLPGLSHPVRVHEIGMWLATVLSAAAITYFMREVLAALSRDRAALRTAERRLERTNHLAALATLSAGAAHELGTPLATVAVVARELERMVGNPDLATVRQEAGLIRDEVDRCREILARMGAEVKRELHAPGSPAALRSLEEALRSELGASERRVVWHTDAPDLVVGGLSTLAQLLLPLVRNALDASTEAVHVRIAHDPRRLHITVEDKGSGMEEAVLDRAGEPLFTTKLPGVGTGLGLHLVRVVTDALGGALELRSAPEQGTRATLTLPYVPSPADALPARG